MFANARMYSVTPAVGAAWKALLGSVLERANLDWRLLDHLAPAPMADLWARNDLGCAMMCGLPYSQRRPRPILVAAPIPAAPRYGGKPVYFTDIAVRADSPFRSLEDSFGHVVGYTLHESMSGYAALRRHLLQYRSAQHPRLYAASVGGLQSPRSVIEALAGHRIDVGPLDSYSHDLLRTNDPQFAAQVRVLATTQAAPIPPLVATAKLSGEDLARLRASLEAAASAPELSALRETLLLKGFEVLAAESYDVFDRIAAEAEEHAGAW